MVEGRPFVGKAGGRLDEALSAAEVDRLAVHITNTVLCHPEGNESPPPPRAVDGCHERLVTEVRLRMPEKVMALGTTASRALTNESRPIKQLRLARPTPNPYLDGDSEVRVTYHPSWVLKNRHGRMTLTPMSAGSETPDAGRTRDSVRTCPSTM